MYSRGVFTTVFALLALLSTAMVVYAQETSINITVTMPYFTPRTQDVWIVYAEYMNDTAVRIRATCMSIGLCPILPVSVYCNGCLVESFTVSNVTCSEPPCSVERVVSGVGESSVIVYEYDGRRGSIRVSRWRFSGYAAFISSAVAASIMLGLIVRSDPRLAGIGMIASSIIVYALVAAGYAPPRALAAAYVLTVIGALIFILYRR